MYWTYNYLQYEQVYKLIYITEHTVNISVDCKNIICKRRANAHILEIRIVKIAHLCDHICLGTAHSLGHGFLGPALLSDHSYLL